MSSESNLEYICKHILKGEIDQLIELQDEGIRLIEKKTEIIENMARKLEASGMHPDKICATIKRILKQNYIEISDWTVEKACGIDKKRKYDRYQSPIKSEVTSDFQQPVTVSSDNRGGSSESYTKPDGSEGERESDELLNWKYGSKQDIRVMEEAAANVLADELLDHSKETEELKIRLNEALTLADDKDKRIEQLLLQNGELEMQVADLKKKPPATKDVDKTEELQIENDNLKIVVEELKEALRANVKASGFTQASHLPKQAWIAAVNAIHFYTVLNKASRYAIEHNDPWRKILFDVAPDGQLKAAKLEG